MSDARETAIIVYRIPNQHSVLREKVVELKTKADLIFQDGAQMSRFKSQFSDVTSVSVRVTSQRHVCIELVTHLIESVPIFFCGTSSVSMNWQLYSVHFDYIC